MRKHLTQVLGGVVMAAALAAPLCAQMTDPGSPGSIIRPPSDDVTVKDFISDMKSAQMMEKESGAKGETSSTASKPATPNALKPLSPAAATKAVDLDKSAGAKGKTIQQSAAPQSANPTAHAGLKKPSAGVSINASDFGEKADAGPVAPKKYTPAGEEASEEESDGKTDAKTDDGEVSGYTSVLGMIRTRTHQRDGSIKLYIDSEDHDTVIAVVPPIRGMRVPRDNARVRVHGKLIAESGPTRTLRVSEIERLDGGDEPAPGPRVVGPPPVRRYVAPAPLYGPPRPVW